MQLGFCKNCHLFVQQPQNHDYDRKNISETSVAQVPAIGLYKKLGYQCASIYLDTKNMLKNSIFISVGITLVACYKKL